VVKTQQEPTDGECTSLQEKFKQLVAVDMQELNLSSTCLDESKTAIILGIRVYVPPGIGPMCQFCILRAGQGWFMPSGIVDVELG
jgi:hypothetical protein